MNKYLSIVLPILIFGCAAPSSSPSPTTRPLIRSAYEISNPLVKVRNQPSPPPYPTDSRIRRVSGDVVMSVTINEHGVPIRVSTISGPIGLRKTAESYLKEFEFFPVIVDGLPIPTSFLFTMPFRLR